MAIALNSTDWKHIDFNATKGATVGRDHAGVSEEIGSAVDPAHELQIGDPMKGFTMAASLFLPRLKGRLIQHQEIQREETFRRQFCRIYRDLGTHQYQNARLDVLYRRG